MPLKMLLRGVEQLYSEIPQPDVLEEFVCREKRPSLLRRFGLTPEVTKALSVVVVTLSKDERWPTPEGAIGAIRANLICYGLTCPEVSSCPQK